MLLYTPEVDESQTDEELIVAYRAGEEQAFSELVGRHLGLVYSFARRFVGNERDAEDIAQDSFLKAWKSIASYSSESAKFKTWLMRIVRNTAIDYLRKRKERPFSLFESDEHEMPFENLSDDAPDAVDLFAAAGDQRELERAIAELSPAHRDVLILYYEGDRTFEEVAAITGESVNTVKSRHRRAVSALRKLLSTQFGQ